MSHGAQDFISWLEARRAEVPWEFSLQCNQHDIRIFLKGLHPAIAITVNANQLRITVEQDGETLDTLLWLEMSPVRSGNAYICILCEPESAKRFDSLAEMREDHLYTTFLDWCQKTLAHATHLELLHTPNVTAARLIDVRDLVKKGASVLVNNPVARTANQAIRWPLFFQNCCS